MIDRSLWNNVHVSRRRTGSTTGYDQVTTDFTWDPAGIGTLLSDGDDYLWGHGLIGRIDANNDATYAHQDGLGSIRLITDDSGAVVGTTRSGRTGRRCATAAWLPLSRHDAVDDAVDDVGDVDLARFVGPKRADVAARDP
jgi:hypothetical protein